MGILKRMAARALPVAAALSVLLSVVPSLRFDHVSAQATPSASVIAVIVSAQSPFHDISKALLKRVFLGEPTELNGVRLLPFNYASEEPLRRRFDELLLGFDVGAAGRYWVDRRIRGQGLPPRVVPNIAIARGAIGKLLHAISYIPANQLDAGVRALRIDGIPYTARDYPLK
jgi:hypothetical protein